MDETVQEIQDTLIKKDNEKNTRKLKSEYLFPLILLCFLFSFTIVLLKTTIFNTNNIKSKNEIYIEKNQQTLQEINERIENGESFVLYIGRDTCKFCNLLIKNISLSSIFSSENFFYLSSRDYYELSQSGIEYGEEAYEKFKESFHYSSHPAFVYYKNGIWESTLEDFIDGNYFNDGKTEEEKEEMIKDAKNALKKWKDDLE